MMTLGIWLLLGSLDEITFKSGSKLCVIASTARVQSSQRAEVQEALELRLKSKCAVGSKPLGRAFGNEADSFWKEAATSGYVMGYWLDFETSTNEMVMRGILIEAGLQWAVVRIHLMPEADRQERVRQNVARLVDQLEFAGALTAEQYYFWGDVGAQYELVDVKKFISGRFLPILVGVDKKPLMNRHIKFKPNGKNDNQLTLALSGELSVKPRPAVGTYWWLMERELP